MVASLQRLPQWPQTQLQCWMYLLQLSRAVSTRCRGWAQPCLTAFRSGGHLSLFAYSQKSPWLRVQTDAWPQSGFSSSEPGGQAATRPSTPPSCPDTATAFQFFSQIRSSAWLASVPANRERTEVLARFCYCSLSSPYHFTAFKYYIHAKS